MDAHTLIVGEFRQNAKAICEGRDPLDDWKNVVAYVKLFKALPCIEPGCNRPRSARNLCPGHYTAAWKRGEFKNDLEDGGPYD